MLIIYGHGNYISYDTGACRGSVAGRGFTESPCVVPGLVGTSLVRRKRTRSSIRQSTRLSINIKWSELLCSLLLKDRNLLIQFALARGALRRWVVGGRLGPRVYIGSPVQKVLPCKHNVIGVIKTYTLGRDHC